jgi:simple sugar transport system ATP-binding protein/ribose transport system ATP-binding protein
LTVVEPPHVETRDLSKRFGGVQALSEVSVSIVRGSIHGLVGENGAGKSTLGKVISGIHAPDAGQLLIDGQPAHLRSPRDALVHGVTTIAQEISLVPTRTAVENVFLGIEQARLGVVDRRRLHARYDALCADVGFDIPGNVPVGAFRVSDQQKVEILRAVARDAKLIVMDEPTAALTADEAERLFAVVRSLRDRGTTIVYVSHFLDEVLALVDTVTVLRDGRLVQTSAAAAETASSLVTAMIGRPMDMAFPAKAEPAADAPVVLSVEGLETRGFLRDISFEIRAGEIVGLAGLVGSGRSEVARALFGADPRSAGTIRLDGRLLALGSPRQAVRAGIALVPESRKSQGLLMGRSITENVTLPHLGDVSRGGFVARRQEHRETTAMIERVDVRTLRPSVPVLALSGGNQQKVLFAKWLFRSPRLLIADEPTRGVDVGAKRAIYELLHQLAAQGMAVLLISSELEEVLGLAHRVLVMRGGEVVARLEGAEISENAVMAAAFATELMPAGRATA